MLPDIRDRTRAAARAEVAAAVFDVFVERGFTAVTADEVAREVGISRATFFRYFGSKEDAVLIALEAAQTDYARVLRDANVPDGADGWHLIRAALDAGVIEADSAPQLQQQRLAIIRSVPSIRARLAERRGEQVEALSVVLAQHLHDQIAARVFATVGLAAYDLAWTLWREQPESTFRETFDGVLARLR